MSDDRPAFPAPLSERLDARSDPVARARIADDRDTSDRLSMAMTIAGCATVVLAIVFVAAVGALEGAQGSGAVLAGMAAMVALGVAVTMGLWAVREAVGGSTRERP